MRIVKHLDFGPVQAYELGYSPFSQPFITTHIYFIDGIMIDTGQRHLSQEVKDLLAEIPVQKVLLTHHHEDHSGNAAMIRNRLEIPILGNSLTIEKMKSSFRILPYQHLFWGKADPVEVLPLPEIIKTDNYSFLPIHAPGHSKDHTVFLEATQGWLFSGDLYLADRVKYFRADERIADEIRSLKMISELDFDSVFCGHNPKPINGKQGIIRKLNFLENLYGNVSDLYKKGLGIKQIMRELEIRESHIEMLICFGNISARNMVKSVITAIHEENNPNPVKET